MEPPSPLWCQKSMRTLRLIMLGLLLSCELHAPITPVPNLAKRIESADVIREEAVRFSFHLFYS